MSRKLKTIMAIIALIAFLAISILPQFIYVRADNVSTLKEKLERAESEKKEAQNKLNSIKSDKSDVEAQKASIDRQLADVENQVYALSRDIAETEERISAKQAELDTAEQELTEYSDTYKERLRIMYENNDTSYLSVIFGAKDFSDLLYRIELVNQVVEYDKGIIKTLDDARQKIEDAKTEIEEEKEVLVLNQQIQKEKAAELESVRAAKQTILNNLQADEEKYKEILDAADREEESLRREIQSLTSQSSSNSGTSAAVYSGGALSWPTPSTTYVTSPYGWRFHPIQKRNKLHTGIDIGAGYGASVIAAEGGTVLRAGWNGGYGQYIVIDHGNGLSTLYAHNSTLLVSAGQVVTRGQKIALVGSTGNSTGPHLHFEVLLYGQTQDPMSYFG